MNCGGTLIKPGAPACFEPGARCIPSYRTAYTYIYNIVTSAWMAKGSICIGRLVLALFLSLLAMGRHLVGARCHKVSLAKVRGRGGGEVPAGQRHRQRVGARPRRQVRLRAMPPRALARQGLPGEPL